MQCFRDQTFCVSPNCKNDCGRQLTLEIRLAASGANLPISTAYFCGLPDCEPFRAVGPVGECNEETNTGEAK